MIQEAGLLEGGSVLQRYLSDLNIEAETEAEVTYKITGKAP
jgi:hypothetical protein